jgi:predicted acetyltransferase
VPPDVRPVAGDADLDALRRLYPLYLHDLSEFTEHYRLDEEGRWQPSYIDDWLGREGTHSLLVRQDRAAVGFALVGQPPFPYMPSDVDHRLAEFFVARPYRRAGVGRAAAEVVLAAFRGRWQLEVVPRNSAALAFWRRVLAGRDVEERVQLGDIAFRFST